MQFRLRTLFIVTTAAALLVWVFFVPPDWFGLIVLWFVHMLLPAISTGILRRGRALDGIFISVPDVSASLSLVSG
jgi:hypothetical protein